MKENKTKPDIRFKGFTDDWEQRKLGDVTQIIMGQSPDGSTYSETPKDYILVQGNSDIKDGWVEPRLWTTQMTKKADVGDLIMSVRAPAGSMGKTAYNVVIGRGVAAIKGNEFIFQSLIKKDIEGFWKKITTGSTFESLNSNDIKNSNLLVPVNEEQIKIGQYFSQLDNLITLHQRECNQLKELKKTMLKKMFPRDGSNIPEVRFAGFTDDWEQRKFKKIFSVSQGLQIPVAERYTEPGVNRYFYITNEFLKENCTEEYYIESPSGNVLCDEEDILMTRTGNTGIVVTGVSGCFHNNFFKIKYDKNKFSKEYICYLLSSSHMQKIILNSAGSSTIPDLSHKSFYKIEGYFPNFKEEQEQIGTYFKQLDNLITLHQRELEILKNLKKTCLKRMFI